MNPRSTPSATDDPSLSTLYEKLLHQGATTLDDHELLGILLGHATPEKTDLISLSQVPLDIKQPHTLKIAALIALSSRLNQQAQSLRTSVHNSTDAYELLQDMAHLPQEHVRIILLDMDRQIIAIPTLYIGTINASVIRISEIFRVAISYNCAAFVLAHNHPASNAQPSPEDIRVTREIITAAKLFDIHFIDHLIISRHEWCSIRELGLAFTD